MNSYLGKISGSGQRKAMDAAIEASETGEPAKAAPAPTARMSPAKKLPGRPAKAKSGLRDFFGV